MAVATTTIFLELKTTSTPCNIMTTPEIVILAFCVTVGWLAMGYTFMQTALLLLASGAVLFTLWLAFVLCLA